MISPSAFSADALLTELLEWVRIESPTYDAATVNRMLDFIALRIAALGFSVERLPGRDPLAARSDFALASFFHSGSLARSCSCCYARWLLKASACSAWMRFWSSAVSC